VRLVADEAERLRWVERHRTEVLSPVVEVTHNKELEITCLVLRTLRELVVHDEFIVVSELRD
jgi:effector-binding domain-containing protein